MTVVGVWEQVDLQKPTLLHGVLTQGVSSKLRDNHITLFTVSYSLDQETWSTYRESSSSRAKVWHTHTPVSGVHSKNRIKCERMDAFYELITVPESSISPSSNEKFDETISIVSGFLLLVAHIGLTLSL